MKYFDFHCHLDAPQLNGIREEILVGLSEQELGCNTIGVDLDSSRSAVALARTNNHVWATIGQHPLDNKHEVFSAQAYQKLIDTHTGEIVAIGECGLDYYWPQKDCDAGKISVEELQAEKQRQKLLFQKNITLAIANSLPLMLHVRSSEGTQDAHEDTLELVSAYEEIRNPVRGVKVVFHFYAEDTALAERIIEAGYYISLPGVITFADMDEVIRAVPLERMFAETDSPYAAPKPYRGKTNQPQYVLEVYKKIADIKQVELEKVQTQLAKNVKHFLGIIL